MRLSKNVLLNLVLILPALAYAQSGKVVFTAGDPVVKGTNFSERGVESGENIFAGNQYDTRNGILQLKLVDGSFISLRPNSVFKVEEFDYDETSVGDRKAKFYLSKGELRTKSGKVGKIDPRNYVMKTPVATIGIRGTTYRVSVIENSFGESLVLNMGEEGGITIHTEHSSFDLSPFQIEQLGGIDSITDEFTDNGFASLDQSIDAIDELVPEISGVRIEHDNELYEEDLGLNPP